MKDNFDVALSYAVEQKPYVDELASELKKQDVGVFYDSYFAADMWGGVRFAAAWVLPNTRRSQ